MPKPAIGASSWGGTLNNYFEERFAVSARDHGADPAASGAVNAAAFTAALAAVPSGGCVVVPAGTYAITGNVTVSNSYVSIMGIGDGTRLNFTDGGLIFNGTAGYLLRPSLRDLRIVRTGTAGPALHLLGAGNSTGVARLTASNLHLQSVPGDALLVEGSYLATFIGCWFEDSVTGIRGKLETTTGIVSANALTFVGGEVYGNDRAWEFVRPSGVSFYGVTTEGNAAGGKITDVARGFTYHGGYFESNQGPDIEVDCNAGAAGILIEGNVFFNTGMTKTESILLKRGRVGINNNIFHGLSEAGGDVAIRISEGTSPVAGEARNNMRDDDGTLVAYTTGGAAFNVTQLGQITKAGSTVLSSTLNEEAGISWVRKVSQALDFGSIAANSEATLTVTVTGAVITDDCSVSSSILEAGLSLKSWGVSANDTVSICLRNNTGSAIDPTARTYRIRVWR